MGAKFGGDDDVIADINITPFVDIILVVLIIFMVTATTIVQTSIKVNLPDASTGEATESTSLGLTLLGDGGLLLDGERVTPEELGRALEKAKAENDEVICLIAADKLVAHGRVIWLMDLVKSKGIAKFALNINKAEMVPPDPASIGEGSAPASSVPVTPVEASGE
ncbi:MAG: biopolymer transporter ExbD [Deltaproteobacteria bacterium]|nr:MAG: biopolymer transporter ExbD [Deltaproteobacteria bacterium]